MKTHSGPAFPTVEVRRTDYPGMSLRDWFAGQALSGADWAEWIDAPIDGEPLLPRVARECYALADAMLAERAKAVSR